MTSSFQDQLVFLEQTAQILRQDVVTMLSRAGSGHLGGSLSVIEMLTALYFGSLDGKPFMLYDPKKPGWEGQDYCILSKAHAAPAWYSVLAHGGFFAKEELHHFRQMNSLLQSYPHKKIPGVPMGSGNPGFGISAAVGLAMALKMDKQTNRVFCLVGEGELQVGQVWEALQAASHYKLDNLTVLLDVNDLQMDGPVRSVMNIDPIADKFEAFGWKTIPVWSGHDFEDLLVALQKALEVQRRPAVIVAKTVKGKGIPFVENKISYHAEVLSEPEMAEALPLLKNITF